MNLHLVTLTFAPSDLKHKMETDIAEEEGRKNFKVNFICCVIFCVQLKQR